MKSKTRTFFVVAAVGLFLAAVLISWQRGTEQASASGGVPEVREAAVPAAESALPIRHVAGPAVQGDDPAPPAVADDRPSIADILEAAGDLSDPATRARAVEAIAELEDTRRETARRRALELGLPLRVERPDGTVQEIVDFEDGRPVYFTTHNAAAAISTGANILRLSPYSLNGSGLTVGMWDGGSGRASHQEFSSGNRMVVKDGAGSIDHATHVGGTIAAAGTVTNARGMATAAIVDSYDWNSDKSEMTSRAAASPGETGKLYLSNHSYGYISGWNYVNSGSPQRVWEWWGSGTGSNSIEPSFGRYNNFARDSDAIAFSAPYFLMFRSAGNERTDNPNNGQAVALSPGSSTVVSYDSAIHPKGDGVYRGGFDTMSFDSLAKNVITVGSVTDAVTSGVRDVSKANISSFSSWGPTDDGRIKPDVVANGDGVYSSLNGSNSSYGSFSGTSMSAPNATGTAALLIQEYGRLFPGGAMRSSTLKGLLIHTADDRGNVGPDYRFGWGLINGVAAANLLRDHAANPYKIRLTEDLITSTANTINHEFIWDGVSPIRATLSWTDPAGTATTTSDLRTARLRNNLDLRIIGPDGSVHMPYVMPFVGTWTQASMDLPATTGKNNVDNVEQVFIANPATAGAYRCVITFDGTLANNQQQFSLLVSGSANEAPPPPTLEIIEIAPNTAPPGTILVDLTGTAFGSSTSVRLHRAGQPDIVGSGVTLVGTTLRCQLDLTAAVAGAWDVTVTNPDNESFTLPAAFTVTGALWSESFDGTVTGWTSAATTGSNQWSLTTSQNHSPPRSIFAPAPASKTTCNLTSPNIPIPSNGSNLQLRFWHSYNLETDRDGGKLEFSINGGTWFDVTSSNSGAVFASNGYNRTIGNAGGFNGRSDFAGQSAWSGNSGGFIETVVNLTNTAKFAGNNLRARWRIATNSTNSSPSVGWYLDSISLVGGGDISNQAPSITSAATSSSTETVTENDGDVFFIVRGQQTGLSVSANDDGGESALTYTWASSHGNAVPVSYTQNGSNAAKSTTALFEATGDYLLTVMVRDAQGLAASSSVNIRVLASASEVSVTPTVASVAVGGQQTFAAVVRDQFGEALGSQPSSFSWSVSGGGGISTAGLFTATAAGGPYVVSASSGGLTGIASVNVNPAAASVTLGNLAQTFDGSPKQASHSTDPPGLAVSLTYDGNTTAPINAGSYAVTATVTDPNYQGSANGNLVISQAEAVIILGNLDLVEDGTAQEVDASTIPGGLELKILYNGSEQAPSTAGVYLLEVSVDDLNYFGETSAQLIISATEEPNEYDEWTTLHFTEAEIAAGLALPNADADGDGTPNLAEFYLGLDPRDPNSRLTMILDPAGPHLVINRVVTSGEFLIEAAGNLAGPWNDSQILEIEADGNHHAVEIAPMSGKRFFRLRYTPPTAGAAQ